jgi:hypothetical protein
MSTESCIQLHFVDFPLTPKYPVSVSVSVSVSQYPHQKRLMSVSVSEGLGVGFSDTDTDIKTVFFAFLKKKYKSSRI